MRRDLEVWSLCEVLDGKLSKSTARPCGCFNFVRVAQRVMWRRDRKLAQEKSQRSPLTFDCHLHRSCFWLCFFRDLFSFILLCLLLYPVVTLFLIHFAMVFHLSHPSSPYISSSLLPPLSMFLLLFVVPFFSLCVSLFLLSVIPPFRLSVFPSSVFCSFFLSCVLLGFSLFVSHISFP